MLIAVAEKTTCACNKELRIVILASEWFQSLAYIIAFISGWGLLASTSLFADCCLFLYTFNYHRIITNLVRTLVFGDFYFFADLELTMSFTGGSGGAPASRGIQELDMDLWCTQCMWGPPHTYSSCPHQANTSTPPQSVYSTPYYHPTQAILPSSIQMPPPPSSVVPQHTQPYYMPWVSLRINLCLFEDVAKFAQTVVLLLHQHYFGVYDKKLITALAVTIQNIGR